jgi:hypothetical protein
MQERVPVVIYLSLPDLEAIVFKHEANFVTFGTTLRAIRDFKLYTQHGYNTWRSYCVRFLKFSDSEANRWIRAASIEIALLGYDDPYRPYRPYVVNRSQALALCPLWPDVEAMAAAVNEAESHGAVTVASIKDAVRWIVARREMEAMTEKVQP